MAEAKQAMAGTFVEPRGSIRSIVLRVAARELAGPAAGGAMVGATSQSPGPLNQGKLAYLAVFPGQLVLFSAKRGAFKPKTTNEILATAPLASAAFQLNEGRIAGNIEITFAEGEPWRFDVPRVHLKGARAVQAAIAA